jgi:hypothetical protein
VVGIFFSREVVRRLRIQRARCLQHVMRVVEVPAADVGYAAHYTVRVTLTAFCARIVPHMADRDSSCAHCGFVKGLLRFGWLHVH